MYRFMSGDRVTEVQQTPVSRYLASEGLRKSSNLEHFGVLHYYSDLLANWVTLGTMGYTVTRACRQIE